ncbi:MAG: histidine phosphatase family protein [Actinomycetes bacterium]
MSEKFNLRIVLWRHGQTDWNVENRYQGHSDIPLNKVGQYQVGHAAKVLAGMNPSRIIASDLTRAKQTAQALVDLTGIKMEIDSDLRETNGGNWEGKTGQQNREEDGERFKQWMFGEDVKAGEIGESRSEVAKRARAAIDRGVAEATGTVIFVTHGGTSRAFLGSILEMPFDKWATLGGLSNASWSVLEPNSFTKTGWTLVEHNSGSIPEPVFGNESLEAEA